VAYCTAQNLIDYLSDAGVAYLTDDDGDGMVSPAEQTAAIDAAIAKAGADIDGALCMWFDAVPVTQENEWLRYRALALAAEYVCGRKGGAVPAAITEQAERARFDLGLTAEFGGVRTGQLRVPGLTYPVDSEPEALRRFGLPRVGNPGRIGKSGRRGPWVSGRYGRYR
jgi:hypothetical protein